MPPRRRCRYFASWSKITVMECRDLVLVSRLASSPFLRVSVSKVSGLETWNQWCSRDRNLRDRDLVKIPRPRSRLHQKLRDSWLEVRDRDFKIRTFCRNFFFNVAITSDLNFFQISGIFPMCFGCFLPANATNKNRWIIQILINHFFAIFKVSRSETFETETETETRKNGSRDEFSGIFSRSTTSHSLVQCSPTTGPRAAYGPPQRYQCLTEPFRKSLQIWNMLKSVWGYICLTELLALYKVHLHKRN